MPMVAWYMLSKESYMKRVMRDVLPTVYTGYKLGVSYGRRSCTVNAYHSVRLRIPT